VLDDTIGMSVFVPLIFGVLHQAASRYTALMRILMLTDSYFPEVGGSETAIRKLGDAMTDAGHTVGVAVISKPNASNPSQKLSFWNVSSRIHGIDCKFLGKIWNLRRIVRSFRPDIINAHFMLESGYVGVKTARAERIPCVVTNRGKGLYNKAMNNVESFLYWLWNRGALHADRFLATSDEMVDILRDRYGRESTVMSNGVDTVTFTPEKNGQPIRDRHGVRLGQRVILCARRLVPKNGIEYIVRALPAIREKHDALLWLASPLIREYERLKEVASELGMSDFVRFLGPVLHDELPLYFRAADVVVQPSIAEARSLACLEAMAAGSAVIATSTGGLKEMITHRGNGYLIDPFMESTYHVTSFDASGVGRLAQAVTDVLGDDRLRLSMGQAARTYAMEYAWPKVAERTLAVYADTITSFRQR
jgi:glycosyltransferase involved in cell wall biosynthesis